MGTRRLYFEDGSRLDFEAEVVATSNENGGVWIELDQTAFYPEGGGQPADYGRISGFWVSDVQETDGVIRHRVASGDKTIWGVGERVHGTVEPGRRWDHTEQHSGQHLLSRLITNRFGLATLAFHLGNEQSSIDVGDPSLLLGGASEDGDGTRSVASPIGEGDIPAIEGDARQAIREGHSVETILLTDPERIAALDKAPKVSGEVRVVVIEGLDENPCGGTHVRSTADLEVLRIRRIVRAREGVARVEFVVGGRAHADHRRLLDQERALMSTIGAKQGEIVSASEKLRDRLKSSEKRVRELGERWMPHRVGEWFARAPSPDGVPIVIERIEPESKEEPGRLAALIAGRGPVLGLLVAVGEKCRAVVVSNGVAGARADQLLRELLQPFDGSGGGSAAIAQGGFPREEDVAALEEQARDAFAHASRKAVVDEDLGRGGSLGGGSSASPESH